MLGCRTASIGRSPALWASRQERRRARFARTPPYHPFMASDEHDPYAPPRAALVPGATRRGSSLNALLVGFLIVFAGTSGAGTLLRLATLLGAVQARFDHIHLAIALRISTFALGCVAALAGGYVCARI